MVSQNLVIEYGNLRCTLPKTLSRDTIDFVDKLISVYKPGYRFSKLYKRHLWDGINHFLWKNLTFPTGLLWLVFDGLQKEGFKVIVNGLPVYPLADFNPTLFDGKVALRDYQSLACQKFLDNYRGIIRVGTGGGKSFIAAVLSRDLGLTTLGLIHGNSIIDQTRKVFEGALGVDIGIIGMGMPTRLERITIASVDALYLRVKQGDKKTLDYLKKVEFVWADEVHRASSESWIEILKQIPTGIRLGLSGTPFNINDYRDMALQAWMGPLLYDVPSKYLQDNGYLAKANLTVYEITQPVGHFSDRWQDAQRWLIFDNKDRTRLICDIAIDRAKKGKRVFLMAGNSISYAQELYRTIEREYRGIELTIGRTDLYHRSKALQMLENGVINIIVCTTIFDEGIDLPSLDCVILANIGKSYRQTLQRIGRGLRGKKQPLEVIDIADYTNTHLRKHVSARIDTYMEEDIFTTVTTHAQ
jgi:superfamily II DNA or RNA helicase